MNYTTSKRIPYHIMLSEPFIHGNEWKYIKECLDTGWVSSEGALVKEFEKEIKEYVGSKHAVAVINGTAALHLSLLALSVKQDEEILVPALTFIAPVNSIRYCRASPVFMDSDLQTLGLDSQKVLEFISKECRRRADGFCYNKKTGKRIRAIIIVHIFGHPADVSSLIESCHNNNIDIIEDATESLGSEYNNRKTGSFGTCGCFSFNGNKIITTGQGGMVVTNNRSIADRIRHLSTQAKKDRFEYIHDDIGYNYRLSNIQAALGLAQLEKLDDFIQIKRKNAARYRELLNGISEVEFLWEGPWSRSNFWFYALKVPKKHKSGLLNFLLRKGIQVRPVWKLIHTLPMYSGFQSYYVEKAWDIYESCINLPCSVGLRIEEIEYVAENIKKYFKY